MIFTFEERPDSRSRTMNPPSQTRIWKAVGEQNDSIVSAYALAGTPPSVFTAQGTLYRQDIHIAPDGFAQYVVTVPYGPRQKQSGSYTWDFDTTGATIKIKAAKEHIKSYPEGAEFPANPHKGAIGVSKDRNVEGADIVLPAMKLSVRFRHPQGIVTLAFAKVLCNVTGTVNANPYLAGNFARGELLFLGGNGSDGSEAEAEIGYHFAASPNTNSLTFDQIAGIVKEGHHYAWVEFEDEEDEGESGTPPKRVHIERNYDYVDFASVFGWGG